MPITWPDRLVTELARRRAVVLLGAGVSSNSTNSAGERPPGWERFLELVAQKLAPSQKAEILALVSRKDLLSAGERLKIYRGPDLIQDIRAIFSQKKFQPAEIHKQVLKLDPRIVITTNFDKIYESYANAPGSDTLSGSLIVKNFRDREIVNVFRDIDRVLIRLHGSVDSLDDLILARSDYARARIEMRHSYEALDALILTHTFLFLGFSMRDPDLQLILEGHAFKYPLSSYHFTTVYGVPEPIDSEFNRKIMKVELLPYEAKTNPSGGEDHSDLTSSLTELVRLVDKKRNELQTTLEW